MWIIKGWCVVTKRVYKVEVAGSCVKNPLQPSMLVFWNAKEYGVAVVETRCYRKVNQDFGSISRQLLSDLSDGIQTAEGLTAHCVHMDAHGEILLKPCPEIADAGNRLDFRTPTVTDSNWTLLNCWQEPTKRNSIFVSFILSQLVII